MPMSPFIATSNRIRTAVNARSRPEFWQRRSKATDPAGLYPEAKDAVQEACLAYRHLTIVQGACSLVDILDLAGSLYS